MFKTAKEELRALREIIPLLSDFKRCTFFKKTLDILACTIWPVLVQYPERKIALTPQLINQTCQ